MFTHIWLLLHENRPNNSALILSPSSNVRVFVDMYTRAGSTFDGLAIAHAVLDYLLRHVSLLKIFFFFFPVLRLLPSPPLSFSLSSAFLSLYFSPQVWESRSYLLCACTDWLPSPFCNPLPRSYGRIRRGSSCPPAAHGLLCRAGAVSWKELWCAQEVNCIWTHIYFCFLILE